MFKEGSLVRIITEDGTGEIMRVLEDSDGDTGVTHVAIGNDDSDDYISTTDLELVTKHVEKQESFKPIFNGTVMSNRVLHDEINRMMVTVIKELRDRGVTDRISLAIVSSHYSGDDSEISYEAYVGGEETIKTDDLFKSANIAANRHFEKKQLHIAKIPHYVKVA